jgi:hypothetical protein
MEFGGIIDQSRTVTHHKSLQRNALRGTLAKMKLERAGRIVPIAARISPRMLDVKGVCWGVALETLQSDFGVPLEQPVFAVAQQHTAISPPLSIYIDHHEVDQVRLTHAKAQNVLLIDQHPAIFKVLGQIRVASAAVEIRLNPLVTKKRPVTGVDRSPGNGLNCG